MTHGGVLDGYLAALAVAFQGWENARIARIEAPADAPGLQLGELALLPDGLRAVALATDPDDEERIQSLVRVDLVGQAVVDERPDLPGFQGIPLMLARVPWVGPEVMLTPDASHAVVTWETAQRSWLAVINLQDGERVDLGPAGGNLLFDVNPTGWVAPGDGALYLTGLEQGAISKVDLLSPNLAEAEHFVVRPESDLGSLAVAAGGEAIFVATGLQVGRAPLPLRGELTPTHDMTGLVGDMVAAPDDPNRVYAVLRHPSHDFADRFSLVALQVEGADGAVESLASIWSVPRSHLAVSSDGALVFASPPGFTYFRAHSSETGDLWAGQADVEGIVSGIAARGVANVELCSGVDDDCDGSVDEGYGVDDACPGRR